MAAEAQFEPAHEAVQPAESTFSAPEPPVVLPFSFAEPPRPTTPFVVPVPATQSYSEAFATTAPPIPAPVVASVSHTGTSIWPASEPMLSSYAPPFRAAELPPAPEPEVYPASAALPAVADAVAAPEVATPAAPSHLPEQLAAKRSFIAPSPSARRGAFERIPILPDPFTDPSPTQRPYRFETAGAAQEQSARPAPPPQSALAAEQESPVATPGPVPVATVPPGTSFPPDRGARLQAFGRRKTDRAAADGETDIPGLTRRWKLLSQFEPEVTDPLPAHRKAYTRSTDVNRPRRNDEG